MSVPQWTGDVGTDRPARQASTTPRRAGTRPRGTAVRADLEVGRRGRGSDRRLAPALATDPAALDEDHATAQRTEVAPDAGRAISRTVKLLTRVRPLDLFVGLFCQPASGF